MKIRRLIIARRVSQALFMGLFLYTLLSSSYSLSGVLPRDIFIRIDPLIQVFGSISGRTIFPGMLFAFLMLILTLAFGRFFCGWICPLGAMIDLFSDIRKKRISLDAAKNRRVSLVKYYILGGMLIFSIFGISIIWMLDPMTITARFFVFGSIPMLVFACGSAFIVKRLWCRAVCPLGAIYALVARYSLLERSVRKCTACFRCKA
ncbi:MAG: 4Fe-4S binding protein, partial [Candidatus Omnitrophica bacterium]|nr:4Fe-4S binding protein [Candidatus Omnitrophota bacterium]